MAKHAAAPSPSVIDLADDAQETDATKPETVDSIERRGSATAAGPASEPMAAGAKPATDNTPHVPRAVVSSVREPGIDFEGDSNVVLPGMKAEKAADYMRKVSCYVADTFSGRVKVKDGTFASFRFTKHEVVSLPKWFALTHPTRLVIKE